MQGRTKEKRYTFDLAFDAASTARDVYAATCRPLVCRACPLLIALVFTSFHSFSRCSSDSFSPLFGPAPHIIIMVLTIMI